MLNNLVKIKIPFISKGYFDKKKIYKYKGNAYIIINKLTDKIIFNTLILDENQIIFGASSGKDGVCYKIKKVPELYNFRNKSFEFYERGGGRKKSVPLKTNIKALNALILKYKLTIKDVDSFIKGAHSSGGLRNPSSDPLRIFFDENDPFQIIYRNNLKYKKNEWNFFSLMSNIDKISKNSLVSGEITEDIIKKITEVDFKTIFDYKWKVIPYGMTASDDLYIDFKIAFGSQNIEKFIDKSFETEILFQSEKNWKNLNYIEYIMECIDNWDRNLVSKQIRGTWKKIIEKDMKENKFSKDFITGTKYYERAHIFSNDLAMMGITSIQKKDEEKKEILNILFSKNNYLLLPMIIHQLWDNNEIKIDKNGLITNIIMSKDDFKEIFKIKNISTVYNNVLTDERKELLDKRGKSL